MINESKIQEAIAKIICKDWGTLTKNWDDRLSGEKELWLKTAAQIYDIFDVELTRELNEQGKGYAEDFIEYTKAMELLKAEAVKSEKERIAHSGDIRLSIAKELRDQEEYYFNLAHVDWDKLGQEVQSHYLARAISMQEVFFKSDKEVK